MTAPSTDLVIVGSTGSIGTQAESIVLANPDRFTVAGVAATGRHAQALVEQAHRLQARTIGISDPSTEPAVRAALTEVMDPSWRPSMLVGPEAAATLAGCGADVVLNGMDGAAGLLPTMAALKAGSRVALANKESLVVGGALVMDAAAQGQIVPVDSEHSAMAQCLRGGRREEVRNLILTASGGPFRGRTREQLRQVTAADALAHPTWAMGPLVTVNSATLMNKALELIEAHVLFDMPLDQIRVVVHPQSVIHSMVEFWDGSTLAQASPPDMALPIALALTWPERLPDVSKPCSWDQAVSWTFEPVDHETFPALHLATRCASTGGCLPAVMNAANEVAVEHFLAGRLAFLDIVATVSAVVDAFEQKSDGVQVSSSLTLDDVLAADRWARSCAQDVVTQHQHAVVPDDRAPVHRKNG